MDGDKLRRAAGPDHVTHQGLSGPHQAINGAHHVSRVRATGGCRQVLATHLVVVRACCVQGYVLAAGGCPFAGSMRPTLTMGLLRHLSESAADGTHRRTPASRSSEAAAGQCETHGIDPASPARPERAWGCGARVHGGLVDGGVDGPSPRCPGGSPAKCQRGALRTGGRPGVQDEGGRRGGGSAAMRGGGPVPGLDGGAAMVWPVRGRTWEHAGARPRTHLAGGRARSTGRPRSTEPRAWATGRAAEMPDGARHEGRHGPGMAATRAGPGGSGSGSATRLGRRWQAARLEAELFQRIPRL